MDWDNIAHVRIHARAAEARIAKLEAEYSRLRTALQEHGEHRITCDIRRYDEHGYPMACSCGLGVALLAAGVQP